MEDNSKLFKLMTAMNPINSTRQETFALSAVFSVYFKIGKSGELKNYIERPVEETEDKYDYESDQ